MATFASLTSGLKFGDRNNAKIKALFTHDKNVAIAPSLEATLSVDALRKRHRIKVQGVDAVDPIQHFSDMLATDGAECLVSNLIQQKFLTPTPVQMQIIPLMLDKRDVLVCAPTGSGKTLSFALPLLLSNEQGDKLQSIIVEPTRELARQVYDQFKLLSNNIPLRISVLGESTQSENQDTAPNILITTPLRLIHTIKEHKVDCVDVTTLVLDEADRLFEDDFLIQTDQIFQACTNVNLRKALFSATIPSGMEEMAKNVLKKDFVRVLVGVKEAASTLIKQELKFCAHEEGKLSTFKQFFHDGTMQAPCLTFVQSVERARDLYNQLRKLDLEGAIRFDVLHSELSKEQRDLALDEFRSGRTLVLVTTDALARGIDFKGVNLVINYDFPQSATSYVHRIGRTARYDRLGTAITLFTRDDGLHLRTIANVMRSSGLDVPEWMLQLKKPTKNDKRKLKLKAIERLKVKDATGIHSAKSKRKREKPLKTNKNALKKSMISLEET